MVSFIHTTQVKRNVEKYLAVQFNKSKKKEIKGERVAFITALSFHPFRLEVNAALDYFT